MPNLPGPTEPVDCGELLRRLRERLCECCPTWRNRDGPEAADYIDAQHRQNIALTQRVAELTEALQEAQDQVAHYHLSTLGDA